MALPTKAERDKYRARVPGQEEGIRQDLYHFQTYAAAGQTSLTFFQSPVGSLANTFADTNMDIAGVLPQGKRFWLRSIQIYFLPGEAVTKGPQADAPAQFVNDVWTFYKSIAWLELTVGDKPYVREAPLMKFPPNGRLGGFAAIATDLTAGAATQTLVDYAAALGKPYTLDGAPIYLSSMENFKLTLNWPTVVALPSTVAARVGIVFGGYIFRDQQ